MRTFSAEKFGAWRIAPRASVKVGAYCLWRQFWTGRAARTRSASAALLTWRTRQFALTKLASTALQSGAEVVSDGLKCFAAVTKAGCTHTAIIIGSGAQAAKTPAFKWVNTALGNIKAALVGTYRAVREKHVPRYLAEFEYRFNRRYDLGAMIPRLAFVALRTAPMPYRCLKLADFQA